MWATYRDSLAEFGGRRVLIVFAGMALLIGFMFNRQIQFGTMNGVNVIYQGPASMGPWPFAVPTILGQQTTFTGLIWVLLMIFFGVPLFVSTLEKGWRELTFSKGTRRWQIFLGRYLSTTTLFFLLVLMSDMPLALRFWWQTGIPTWHIGISVVIQTFNFASLLAVGALASLAGENVTVPIIAPVGMLALSQMLLNRREYFTSAFGRWALDWLYYILPKCWELETTASAFIQSQTISSAWPLWTTGLFILATLTMTLWCLERRSF